jgi:hypothetical protein
LFAQISSTQAVLDRSSTLGAAPGRRCPRWSLQVWVLAAWLAGCGPSYPESEYPSAPPAGVTVSDDDYAPAPPGALWRKDVDEVIEGGLGKFLQRADLRPEVHEGTFVGFRVVELRPPAWWQGVDLVPGDVVTRVNGMPIEQPTDAHAAFEALRKSDKLVVSYLREGQPRELIYSIIEKPARPSAATPVQSP